MKLYLAPTLSGVLTGPKGGLLLVEIEATPEQLKRVRTWLERIGLTRRAQPGASFPRAYPGGSG